MVLGGSGAAEKVVVGKGLQTGRLANCEAETLGGIIMDVIVAVLGNVACYRGRWPASQLDAKPVGKEAVALDGLFDVAVCRVKFFRKVRKRWG